MMEGLDNPGRAADLHQTVANSPRIRPQRQRASHSRVLALRAGAWE
jgi:hypothetical protein